MKTKKIDEIRLKIDEIRTDFGNPRRIERSELEKLKRSITENGDFGLIVINEQNQVLSGNQRIAAMKELGVEEVLCKRLIGYSEEEQKRVLLEANATRGKYVFSELMKFVEGTGIDVDEYKITGSLAKTYDIEGDNAAQETDAVHVLPLVVAVSEEEYAEFEAIKKRLGLKKNIGVIKKILKIGDENV